jgi:hypothetical protein
MDWMTRWGLPEVRLTLYEGRSCHLWSISLSFPDQAVGLYRLYVLDLRRSTFS